MRLTARGNAEWECVLVFVGEDWDGDHGHPFTGTVDGFILTAAALDALHRHVASWLDGPLEALVSARLDASFELAEPGQTVSFRFGPNDKVMTERGKPVVNIRFSIGALTGSFHIVSDQSCLALFAEGLGQALQGEEDGLR
jgi:hypothetical protein